jgi:hypothetical protein
MVIGDHLSLFWLFRNLLFSAYLPALEHMLVIVEIHADSSEYAIPMPTNYSERPILSEQMARSLSSLTFRFDVYGDGDIAIMNWSVFEALLRIPAQADIISYDLGPKTGRLPRLL